METHSYPYKKRELTNTHREHLSISLEHFVWGEGFNEVIVQVAAVRTLLDVAVLGEVLHPDSNVHHRLPAVFTVETSLWTHTGQTCVSDQILDFPFSVCVSNLFNSTQESQQLLRRRGHADDTSLFNRSLKLFYIFHAADLLRKSTESTESTVIHSFHTKMKVVGITQDFGPMFHLTPMVLCSYSLEQRDPWPHQVCLDVLTAIWVKTWDVWPKEPIYDLCPLQSIASSTSIMISLHFNTTNHTTKTVTTEVAELFLLNIVIIFQMFV